MAWPPPREERRPFSADGVDYEPGLKFKVVREGARLTGVSPDGRNWRKYLTVGDVIECAGYGPGWGGDPGFGVEFRNPDDHTLAEFHPWIGGAHNYRPEPGFLEPVD